MKTNFETLTGRASFFANELVRLNNIRSKEIGKGHNNMCIIILQKIEEELENLKYNITLNLSYYNPKHVI